MNYWIISRYVIVAMGTIWFIIATLAASNAVLGMVEAAILMLLGLVTGVAWIVYSLICIGFFRSLGRCVIWITVPLAPIVATIGFATSWPMAARVWMCERSLREHAESCESSQVPSRLEEPARVGLFNVYTTERDKSTVYLTTGMYIFDVGGVVYSPNEPPTRSDGAYCVYRHLYGPWYRYLIPD